MQVVVFLVAGFLVDIRDVSNVVGDERGIVEHVGFGSFERKRKLNETARAVGLNRKVVIHVTSVQVSDSLSKTKIEAVVFRPKVIET